MQLSNLMLSPKATWSTWEGPDSEDVKAFKDAAWHQMWLKSMKIGHIALNSFGNLTGHIPTGKLAIHLRKISPEVCKRLSKMDLSPLSKNFLPIYILIPSKKMGGSNFCPLDGGGLLKGIL